MALVLGERPMLPPPPTPLTEPAVEIDRWPVNTGPGLPWLLLTSFPTPDDGVRLPAPPREPLAWLLCCRWGVTISEMPMTAASCCCCWYAAKSAPEEEEF